VVQGDERGDERDGDIKRVAMPSDHAVERTVRNFVHSESSTRPNVTRASASSFGAVGVTALT